MGFGCFASSLAVRLAGILFIISSLVTTALEIAFENQNSVSVVCSRMYKRKTRDYRRLPCGGSRTSDRMYLLTVPHFCSLMASPRQQVIDKKQKVKIPIMIQSIEKQIPSHATLHSLLALKS